MQQAPLDGRVAAFEAKTTSVSEEKQEGAVRKTRGGTEQWSTYGHVPRKRWEEEEMNNRVKGESQRVLRVRFHSVSVQERSHPPPLTPLSVLSCPVRHRLLPKNKPFG